MERDPASWHKQFVREPAILQDGVVRVVRIDKHTAESGIRAEDLSQRRSGFKSGQSQHVQVGFTNPRLDVAPKFRFEIARCGVLMVLEVLWSFASARRFLRYQLGTRGLGLALVAGHGAAALKEGTVLDHQRRRVDLGKHLAA